MGSILTFFYSDPPCTVENITKKKTKCTYYYKSEDDYVNFLIIFTAFNCDLVKSDTEKLVVLSDNEETYEFMSRGSILRYIGRKTFTYPNNNKENSALVDDALCDIEEAIIIFNHDGTLPQKMFEKYEKVLGEYKYITTCETISVSDILLFTFIENLNENNSENISLGENLTKFMDLITTEMYDGNMEFDSENNIEDDQTKLEINDCEYKKDL
tara:strand:+ start:298 stop:936 length:639 start_codon:yes stop_codon:yes gene_type:complete